jgi:hypothetical protein
MATKNGNENIWPNENENFEKLCVGNAPVSTASVKAFELISWDRLCLTYICPKRQTLGPGGSFYKSKLLDLQRYPSECRNTVSADV